MFNMARAVTKQSEFAIKEVSCVASTPTEFKFSTPKNQVWEVYEVNLECPPLTGAQIKYDEESTGNTITLDGLTAYEFPLRFKKTATDVPLILVEDRDFYVYLTNNEPATRKFKVIIKYIKKFPQSQPREV